MSRPARILLAEDDRILRKAGEVSLKKKGYDVIPAVDGEDGWDADAWEDALEPYFAEHDEIGTGPDARGPGLLIIEELPAHWQVRQIFDDPAGDHDWGLSARVDLAASDEAGEAVLTVTDVGQLG